MIISSRHFPRDSRPSVGRVRVCQGSRGRRLGQTGCLQSDKTLLVSVGIQEIILEADQMFSDPNFTVNFALVNLCTYFSCTGLVV